jgi:hypothetical protein
LTTLALGFSVLVVVGLYAATASQPDSEIAAKIAHEIGLSRDRSMGEIVIYGMAFMASALFFLASVENRSLMLFFLSTLMAFVWFDDSAGYHERFGRYLVEVSDLPRFPRLRPQDTGELIAWALAGLVLTPVFLLSLLRRRPGDLGLLALFSAGFGVLALCGIVTDLLHMAAPQRFNLFFAVIEDGGEMFAIALISGLALGLARNGREYYSSLAPGTHVWGAGHRRERSS